MSEKAQSPVVPTPKAGQVWQEFDPRFPDAPFKEVISCHPETVVLRTMNKARRVTQVKASRFTGKRGCYRFVAESTAGISDQGSQAS